MEKPILEIAAGILLGGTLLASFLYGFRAFVKTDSDPEYQASTRERMGMMVPVMFLLYCLWRYL